MTFELYPGAVQAMLMNPAGGLARELERVGDGVVRETKINLGREAPNFSFGHFFEQTPIGVRPFVVSGLRGNREPHGAWRNPPPGPPHLRTGDLQASVQRTQAYPAGDHLQVDCFAPAQHRGDEYATFLLRRGYKFIDLARSSL